MKLGFSGTQATLPALQIFVLQGQLQRLLGPGDEFHHGDCVGADKSAHGFVVALKAVRPGLTIVGHPPLDERKRAFTLCDVYWPARSWLTRNRDIVDVSERMVFTPRQDHEVLRSGTWSTIRYARRQRKPIMIVFPDGRVEEEVPTL
jgi:hypothetical protein